MVGRKAGFVGIIGNGNPVGKQLAGGSSLVEADIDGTVNIHTGVLHTGPGGIRDTVAGGLCGVLFVVCQFGLQLANIQNVVKV